MAMSRNGITPVVAIVLLLMMTVAIAGGAFAFFSDFMDRQQDNIDQGLNFDFEVKDIQCSGTDVTIALKNQGDAEVNAGNTRVFLYNTSSKLVTTGSTDASGAGFEEAGGFGQFTVTLSDSLNAGWFYNVEIDFESAERSIETSCRAD